MSFLLSYPRHVSLDSKHSISDTSQLAQSIHISQTCFYKLNTLWKSLDIKGNPSLLQQIQQTSWLLFISIRISKLSKTTSLSDCMYLLIGTLSFVLERLPSYLSSLKTLSSLHSISINYTDSERAFWHDRVLEFSKELLTPLGILIKKDNLQGILSRKYIKKNLCIISNFYESCLETGDFDEREFKFTTKDCLKNKKNDIIKRNIKGKVLSYETEQSDCNDIINITDVSTTPMTMSMEMLKWISDIIQEKYVREEMVFEKWFLNTEGALEYQEIIDKVIIDYGREIESLQYLLNYQDSIIEAKIMIFYDALYRKLTKEKFNELSFKYDERSFLTCLFVFCVEAVLYQKNITVISFTEVLDAFDCPGFDFFKFIPVFINIPKIPTHFKQHIAQIENKILMHIGWKESSPIHLLIQEYISNSNAEPQENNFNKFKGLFPEEYEIFFDRMVTEAGCRIDTLCKVLKIDKPIEEKIWSTVKFVLSERTEILFGRHISTIILCSIFAVSKLTNPIKFAVLADVYKKTYNEDEGIFSNIKLHIGKSSEIVEFYNTEFIQTAKEFLENQISPIKPRVAALGPNNSLAQQITGTSQQKKSPFTTPRTKKLLASPNTQACKINILSFDCKDPPKIPRLVERMLLQNNEGVIPMPIIKKNNE
ncbi:hypothetical protein SteCoe_34830 [Stentor coeruleus]|uniref:Retinoblastoma-associated protein A-box domain-containing protein n=1 Tax=Stentor coeruleus TaxID=5963 RepID=A0A1R2ATT9_9CILI|nr:hypothetical protein SteCoe_34830 [Stentor coeruleus]